MSASDILKTIKDNDVKFVDFRFTDPRGKEQRIGLQSFINMGVNLGVLPTKGITLPLMSYGGSSAVVFAVTFALLLRVEWELKQNADRQVTTSKRSLKRNKQ